MATPDPGLIAYQLSEVTARQGRQQDWLKALDKGHADQAITVATHEERLDQVEGAVNRLADTVNKGVWALVGFSFTVAASAVGLAIAIAGGHP